MVQNGPVNSLVLTYGSLYIINLSIEFSPHLPRGTGYAPTFSLLLHHQPHREAEIPHVIRPPRT